jgi:hypothetical protein
MKMVKSLILGSAAGLVAMSGAQAADLPVKAKAVEYVRICSLYGAGFFYIPGTDTCIKLGGYVRIDTTFNGAVYDQPSWSGDLGLGDRFRENYVSRSRMALTVDTRTATEYGVVRTFGQGDFQFTTLGAGGGSTQNPASLASNLGSITNGGMDVPGGGYVAVEMVFLQFAGFTFGKSASAYATPWHGYPGNNTSYLIGGHDTVTGVNNIQYTAQFGNGVSGTVGLDDPTVFNRTAIYNLATGAVAPGLAPGGVSAAGVAGNAYGGVQMPDIVGNIRVDQAWGLFQVSAALHEVNASYNTLQGLAGSTPANPTGAAAGSQISGSPTTKFGGSVMAAINIKNIPTGAGDDIKFDASWAKGDTKNVISTSATSPNFLMLGGVPGQLGPTNSIAFGATTDAMYLPVAAGGDGTLHLTTAYGVRGAFNHNWDPYWSTSVFGGMGWVRYDAVAQANYCAAYAVSGVANPGTYTCNPNYTISMLGTVTRWTPVKNLTFSAEVLWAHLTTGFTGFATFNPGSPVGAQTLSFKAQDTVSFNVRAQRNF